MKKRSISLVLALCLAVSIFTAFSAEAFAAKDYSAYVDQVEIHAGDIVSAICADRGMSYAEAYQAIMIVNGFTSPDVLDAVKPGQKILIPKNAEAAKTIVQLSEVIVQAVIPKGYVMEYTISQGDSMFSICGGNGLSFGACKQAIMALNGWTNEASLSYIKVNQKIILPASDTCAKEILSIIAKAVDANTPVSSGTGDEFEYYLVTHTMASGENVKSVCTALGISYTKEIGELVKTINGLSNVSKVFANRDYLFPSTSSENAVYAVYAHKIVSGDTTGNLCKAYGVEYSKVADILAGLNPKMSMSSIRAGATMHLISLCGTGEGKTPVVIR